MNNKDNLESNVSVRTIETKPGTSSQNIDVLCDKFENCDSSDETLSFDTPDEFKSKLDDAESFEKDFESTFVEEIPKNFTTKYQPSSCKDEEIKPLNFVCIECTKTFSTQDELDKHRTAILKSNVTCPLCHITFESEMEKLQHIRCHPVSDLQCQICYYKCNNSRSWCEHQLYHLGVCEFECKNCGLKCKSRAELKSHSRLHSGEKPYKCETCSRKFSSNFLLKRHLFVHLKDQEVECKICQKFYKNAVCLLKHRQTVHLKKKFIKKRSDFICKFCNLVFHSTKKLSWHLETHERWPKKCDNCGDSFIHRSNLIKHIRMKHDSSYVPVGSEKDTIFCNICNKAYKSTSYGMHMRTHSNFKPFKCEVCGKEFSAKCNYLAHKWVHLGARERPFKCKLCEKSFHRKMFLEAHIRSHKKIRPFTCNECGKSFIYKGNYQSHLKLHTDPKNFECSHCGKLFHRKYNLDNHIRIHTGETPFECTICRKEFTQKSNYNMHMRAFHIERQPVHEEL